MVSDAYQAIIGHLVRTQRVETHRFRRSLRGILEEKNPDDDEIEYEFSECFGNCSAKPTAYRVDFPPEWPSGWAHVHLYEVKLSHRIPDWKLEQYGCMADGEGALFTLHIIGPYGTESIIENDTLASLWTAKQPFLALAAYLAEKGPSEGAIPTASHAVVATSKRAAKLTLQQKKNAAFKALRELGIIA